MGVNITAIFPQKLSEETIHHLIDQIEAQKCLSIKDFYNTTVSKGFPESSHALVQWYVNEEKVSKRPKLPNINAAIAIPEQLTLQFSSTGFLLWSMIRAHLAISEESEIAAKFKLMCTEIAKKTNVTECWIMGDDNPIYHAFIQNKDFKSVASQTLQVASIEELYQEIELEDEWNYTIKGYCKLILP